MKVEAIRQKPVEPPVVEVVLRLSPTEAKDLLALCGSIGGSPYGTIRETLDPLYTHLYAIFGDVMGRVQYKETPYITGGDRSK